MLNLGELILEHLLGLERDFYALAERTTSRKSHLHCKVALVESRNKLGSKTCEQQQRGGKQGKGDTQCLPYTRHAEMQNLIVYTRKPCKEAVGKRRFK